MFTLVRTLLEMIRFSHTVFALPFALLSATLAWQTQGFRWLELAGILLCMVFARSAAMAFNRLVDRDIDAANPRTAARHLPTHRVTLLGAVLFIVICAGGFVASTLIFLQLENPWPLYLSVPVLLFIATYSYTKRFTVLSHFWLGTALMLAPLATWIAIRGMDGDIATPLVLGLAVLFWVAGFDIIYACQDADFDRRAGLYSIPSRLGVATSLRVALACHVVMVALLAYLWVVSPYLGFIYLGGVAMVTLLLAYEHWLVSPNDLTRVNQAFFYVNGVVSVGLLAAALLEIALRR
jgi:4-hydroxybenzoate polyprenyltransferase